MILHQTKLLKEAAKEPTQLDIERIINQRTYSPSREDTYALERLEAGELGEKILVEYLERHGREEWIIIRNMWMNHYGPFEGDLLLLTNHGIYLFEVKNYSTHFTYEDGISKFNGQTNSSNSIDQTRRNTINLQNIYRKFSKRIKTQGVLVLIGVDNYVEINSEITDIDVIQRNQLKFYIQKIVEKEDSNNEQPLNKQYLIKLFEKHEIERYYGPKVITKKQMNNLRKGIYCFNCHDFEIKINRKTVECACGFREERETAILRTICEYGVLTFNENMKIGDLLDFFDYQISHVSLRKVLKKFFIETGTGRYTSYINLNLPHYKLYEELNHDSLVEVTMSHEEFYKLKQKLHESDH